MVSLLQQQFELLAPNPATLLRLVDGDPPACLLLPPSSLKALHSFLSRAPPGVPSGLALCALVSATVARLSVQGPGAVAGEEAKELGTLALHKCAAAAAAAARTLAAAAAAGDAAGCAVEAACLPTLTALLRGLGGAPSLFRRSIPDAVVLGLFVLRHAPPASPLSGAAAQLVATAALCALRQGVRGQRSSETQNGSGGTQPLDASQLVRALLALLSRHSAAIPRFAVFAPVEWLSDADLAAMVLGTLPAEGCGNARASKELLQAVAGCGPGGDAASSSVGGGGGRSGAAATPAAAPEALGHALCRRACGAAAVLTALLRRPLPHGTCHAPALRSVVQAEGLLLPLGALLCAAERLCDAAADVEAGAAAVQAETAAAALRDGAWRIMLAQLCGALSHAGLRLLRAALDADGAAVARRHRSQLSRCLLRALVGLRAPAASGAVLRAPGSQALPLLLRVAGTVEAWLRGPGIGLPTPDTCAEACSLVNACADAAAAPIGEALWLGGGSRGGEGGVPAALPLPDALALAAALVQHAWAALQNGKRAALERAALALAGCGVLGESGAAPLVFADSVNAAAASSGGKRQRSGEGGGEAPADTPLNASLSAADAPPPPLAGPPVHAALLQRSPPHGAPPLLLLSAAARTPLVALLSAALVCPWANGVQSPLSPRLHAALQQLLLAAPALGEGGCGSAGLLLGALSHRAVVAAVPMALPAADGGEEGAAAAADGTVFAPRSAADAPMSAFAPPPLLFPMAPPPPVSGSGSGPAVLGMAVEAGADEIGSGAPAVPPQLLLLAGEGAGAALALAQLPASAAAALAPPPLSSQQALPPQQRLSSADAARLSRYADALGADFPSL